MLPHADTHDCDFELLPPTILSFFIQRAELSLRFLDWELAMPPLDVNARIELLHPG
jgi:hypothetical protein